MGEDEPLLNNYREETVQLQQRNVKSHDNNDNNNEIHDDKVLHAVTEILSDVIVEVVDASSSDDEKSPRSSSGGEGDPLWELV